MHKVQMDQRDILMRTVDSVNEMYDFLARYQQKVPTQDTIKLEDMREYWITFQNHLATGLDYIADHNAEMIENLHNDVNELNDAVLNITDTVKSGAQATAVAPWSSACAIKPRHHRASSTLQLSSYCFDPTT